MMRLIPERRVEMRHPMTTTWLEDIDAQRVRLEGRGYVILSEDEFDRLVALARADRRARERTGRGVANEAIAMTADAVALSRRLLSRRRQAGLTQLELARRADVRVETINRIERGRVNPDFATIRKLVAALNAAQPRPKR